MNTPEKDPIFPPPGTKSELEEGTTFSPRFGVDGLIPAIVTDEQTGDVLMFAHMDANALRLTIETQTAHFFSRSRGRLWKKGEESGNLLKVVELRTDCDQDVIWLKVSVSGHGAACHTGRRTCFYRAVELGASDGQPPTLSKVISERLFEPKEVYSKAKKDKA